jgi:hypothetical protein
MLRDVIKTLVAFGCLETIRRDEQMRRGCVAVLLMGVEEVREPWKG